MANRHGGGCIHAPLLKPANAAAGNDWFLQ
jgi:hypothetical protein